MNEALARFLADAPAPRLHAIVAVHHGEVILEHYGVGEDRSWNRSLGVVTFGPETLHDVRSVTKSVVALLYGIGLDEGLVPAPEEPLYPSFPGYADLGADPERLRITVEHALTMRLGLAWNEDAPYTSLENSEIAMEFAPDRYRYVLERPIDDPSGTRWNYCGGATTLLGKLVSDGSGMPLEVFGRERLFEPLGIENWEWMRGEDGEASAASGLRLAARDLARIGELVLAGGGDVVPKTWLDRMLTYRVTIEDWFGYGYQWYVSAIATPDGTWHPWFGALGNGGQRIDVIPDLDLVVAFTGGAYDEQDTFAMTMSVLEDVILANLAS